ncbi:hypothetical protein CVT24_006035 [Panaeolus cyanescens]|uniref:F-box domain-containing protein n=1 Tax=Panaeolus cyanescens TaxID=181874 RepID=A0A409YE27_9AGAR|nr:hypothetical protein CVT24_006035 [Panaeolus cyanescens]
MVELPNEVWYHIASFVPQEEWNRLLAINHVFLDIAFNMRYSEVLLITRHATVAMKILDRVSDPFIAKRVKTLTLRLTHIKEQPLPSRAASSSSLTGPMSLAARDNGFVRTHLHDTLQYIFRSARRPPVPAGGWTGNGLPSPATSPAVTFGEIMQKLIEITPRFLSVKTLSVDSWDLPPAFDLRPLYEAFWGSRPSSTITLHPRFSGLHKPIPMTFGDRLTTLFIGGNLENHRVLIKSRPRLASLQELRIEFTNNLFRVDPEADAEILVRDIATFVKGMGSTLKKLCVWSWASTDLSMFFTALAGIILRGPKMNLNPVNHFPVLDSLHIRTPFNRAFRDPSGLKDLIAVTSSSLKQLELRLNPSGLAIDPACELPLAQWLIGDLLLPSESESSNSSSEGLNPLANLTILDIYPTNLGQGIDFLLDVIKKCSGTLVDVTIRDRYLQPAEATVVIEALAKCKELKALRFNVWRLDLDLLDLLAKSVPGVERFWVSVSDDWRRTPDDLIGQQSDAKTMNAFARSIPSLTSFYGNGHLKL